MDKFLIKGPCKIKGEVSISGSKNSALPILAATILFDNPVEIKNLPRVEEMRRKTAFTGDVEERREVKSSRRTRHIHRAKHH